MSYLQIRNLISLLNISTTIALATYIVTRTKMFRRAMSLHSTLQDKTLLGTIFGMLSILGSLLGGGNFSDSVLQASMIGPAVAGIAFGPLPGLLAGLIGGIHGLFYATLPAWSAFISCVFSGLMGGLLYCSFGHKRLTFFKGYILGIACEACWYLMVLATNSFSSLAVFYVEFLMPSTFLVNPAGVGIILIFMHDINLGREQSAAEYSQRILNIVRQSTTQLTEGFSDHAAIEVVNSIRINTELEIVGICNFEKGNFYCGRLSSEHEISRVAFDQIGELLKHIEFPEQIHERRFCSQKLAKLPVEGIDQHISKNVALTASPIIVNQKRIGALYAITSANMSHLTTIQIIAGIAGLIGEQVQQYYIEQQQKLLVDAEYRALKAQINPHFLFNTLTVINSLVRSNSHKAQEVIKNLAGFYRKTLTFSGDLSTLEQEIEICSLYLSIQKARYEDNLIILIDISPGCEDVLIPSFSLQPIVENSFNHGFMAKTTTLKLEISAQVEDNHLEVLIRDNGEGFPQEVLHAIQNGTPLKTQGIGLTNINHRLKMLFGAACSLNLKNSLEGAQVRLRVPLQNVD